MIIIRKMMTLIMIFLQYYFICIFLSCPSSTNANYLRTTTNQTQLSKNETITTLDRQPFARENEFPRPAIRLDLIHREADLNHRVLSDEYAESSDSSSIAPLYQGRGIHYSFLWVGNPPQRVSVIMDTGSHHTAFPCVGCKCGKHMDPYFDPSKSSSSAIKSCGIIQSSSKCFFRQSYSEGSSWHAYKVIDKVFIGGEKLPDQEQVENRSVPFEFGCQDYEAGLFRTQYVDGIMGLSASDETLPYQLYKHQITSTKMFALCFRHGGGMVTFGGVDSSLHVYNNQPSEVIYAKLTRPRGWFTVHLIDILMIRPGDSEAKSIGGPLASGLGSKGSIVDSGTTDTYLPVTVAGHFRALFQSLTKLDYDNKPMKLDSKRFHSLPIIIYRLEGLDGKPVDIRVHPNAYMEKQSAAGATADTYTPRIYLTEPSGAVLGANFIVNYNTIFDIQQQRIGFARSTCIP